MSLPRCLTDRPTFVEACGSSPWLEVVLTSKIKLSGGDRITIMFGCQTFIVMLRARIWIERDLFNFLMQSPYLHSTVLQENDGPPA